MGQNAAFGVAAELPLDKGRRRVGVPADFAAQAEAGHSNPVFADVNATKNKIGGVLTLGMRGGTSKPPLSASLTTTAYCAPAVGAVSQLTTPLCRAGGC